MTDPRQTTQSYDPERPGEDGFELNLTDPGSGTQPEPPRPRATPKATPSLHFLSPPLLPGEIGRLGGYCILEVLGVGGMGLVFRAEDPALKRPVAIKVMRPELAANDGAADRFLREARAAAALRHDHIVTIYQVGQDRGVPFLALEYLRGESLDARLKRDGRLPVAEVMRVGREVALGLQAAHDAGLVHRDIKPANVWLEAPGGRAKILDFGLARGGHEDVQLTGSGAVVGTPAYMSPEQANGQEVDHRSDLFSLGVMLYRLVTGEPPFKGESVMAILSALTFTAPVPPRELVPDIPPVLDQLILELLDKDRGRRPPTAAAVADRLAAPTVTVVPLGPPSHSTEFDFTATDDDDPSPPPRRKARRRLPGWAVGALVAVWAAVLAGGVLLGVQIIEVTTPRGKLVIESDDPNVEVLVKKDGAVVRDKTRDRELVLKVGEYTIELADAKDGLKLTTDKFTIERDGKVVVRVRLEKPKGEPAKPPVVAKTPAKPASTEGLAKLPLPKFPAGPSPLDRLDAAKVPEAERPEYQPKEAVAVIGSHERRTWGSPFWHLHGGLAYSPDGKHLVAADFLNLYVYDAATMRLIARQPVMDFAESDRGFGCSPDGKTLYANTSHVWDLSRGGLKQLVEPGMEKTFGKSRAVSPDGKRLAFGTTGGDSGIIDLTKPNAPIVFKWTVTGHCKELAFSPDNCWLLAGEKFFGYRFFRVTDGKWAEKHLLKSSVFGCRVAYSFTAKRKLALVAAGGGIVPVDLSGEAPQELDPAAGLDQIVDFAVDSTGEKWAATRHDYAKTGAAELIHGDWRGNELREMKRVPLPHVGYVAFAPDSKSVATHGHDRAVHVWDVTGETPVRKFRGEHPQVDHVSLSPDGALAASIGYGLDGDLTLWTITDGQFRRKKTVQAKRPLAGSFWIGNSTLVTQSHPGLQIPNGPVEFTLWDVTPEGLKRRTAFMATHTGWKFATSKDGTRLIESNVLWDLTVTPPKQLAVFKELSKTPFALGFSPDNKWLAAADSGLVKLFDVSTQDAPPVATGPDAGSVTSLIFAPDGASFVTVATGGTVQRWERTGAELVSTLKYTDPRGFGYHTTNAAFSPDGKRLYVGSGLLTECDATTGVAVRSWSLPGWCYVHAMADGKHLWTQNANGTTYILRVAEAAKPNEPKDPAPAPAPKPDRPVPEPPANPVANLDPATILAAERPEFLPKSVVAVIGTHARKHWASVNGVAVSPDGKLVASAGGFDGQLRLYDAAAMKEKAVWAYPSQYLQVRFLTDSRLLMWCPTEVVLWDVTKPRPAPVWAIPGGASSLALSSDHKRLAAGDDGGGVRVFDISLRPRLVASWANWHAGRVSGLAFVRDDKQLVSAGLDGEAKVWSAITGKPVQTLQKFTHAAGVATDSAGKIVVARDDGDRVRVYDFSGPEAKLKQDITQSAGGNASQLAVSRDGKRFAVRNGTDLQLWNLPDPGADPVATLPGYGGIPSFTPSGAGLFIGNGSGSVWAIDLTGDKPVELNPAGQDFFQGPQAVTAWGQVLMSRAGLGPSFWLDATGTSPRRLNDVGASEVLNNGYYRLTADGRTLFAARYALEEYRLTDAKPVLVHSVKLPNHAQDMSVSADGRTVAVSELYGTKLWLYRRSPAGFEPLPELTAEKDKPFGTVRLTADGKRLFSDNGNLYDLTADPPVKWTPARPFVVDEMGAWDLSADGKVLATWHGTRVKRWDVTGADPRLISSHTVPDTAIAGYYRLKLSTDGKKIAIDYGLSAGKSGFGRLIVWDVNAPKLEPEEFTFPWVVNNMLFTPDGTHLVTYNSNFTGYVIRLGGAGRPAGRKR